MDWMLAEAKNKFSEVIKLALTQGPQRVRRRNESVVILDEKEYQRLTGVKPSFKEFLMKGPSFEELNLTRDESLSREFEI